MGRFIQQNNGKTTVYVTGENFNNLTASTDTYFIGEIRSGCSLTSGAVSCI